MILVVAIGAGLGLVAALVAVTFVGSRRITRDLAGIGSTARIGDLRVHYVDRPGDPTLPPVVVIHGASGNLHEPRAALEGRISGHRVVYFDRPGHGHSTRSGRHLSAPAAQAEILIGLLDHLRIPRAVLVGHSWGAAVAAAAAVHHPGRVAGLVFVAPATHPWPGGVTWYYRAAAHPVFGPLFAWTLAFPIGSLVVDRAANGVFHPERVPARYRRDAHIELVLRPQTFVANAEDVADLKANVIALSPRYPEISAPTVIVTGDRDSVVWPSIHAKGLERDIAGAELVELRGAGHMPHHTHPEVVVAAIDRVTARAGFRPAAAPLQT